MCVLRHIFFGALLEKTTPFATLVVMNCEYTTLLSIENPPLQNSPQGRTKLCIRQTKSQCIWGIFGSVCCRQVGFIGGTNILCLFMNNLYLDLKIIVT